MNFIFKQILVLNGYVLNLINKQIVLKHDENILIYYKKWWKYFLEKFLKNSK